LENVAQGSLLPLFLLQHNIYDTHVVYTSEDAVVGVTKQNTLLKDKHDLLCMFALEAIHGEAPLCDTPSTMRSTGVVFLGSHTQTDSSAG
jgi:hypothetical protein